jgi:glycosyltransferase involved in cell wall biosynthesis
MRLAWFTPWPPQRSGIAAVSSAVVRDLAARGHGIDVFADASRVPVEAGRNGGPTPGGIRVLSAHDFVWRHALGQYDLPVYQVGNSGLHQFIWPYLLRWPGLAVLHDTKLHHARGHALLQRGAVDDYRVEFAWCHPGQSPDAAELAVRGFDGAYYYDWPMIRGVLDASRLTAAHSAGSAAAIDSTWPGHDVAHIPLSLGRSTPASDADRRAARGALGVPAEAPLFGVFGALTAEKRLRAVFEAFAGARPRLPDARLLLAGTADPALDLDRLIRDAGLGDRVALAGRLDDDAFESAIAAVDVSLNLRWPSAGETSGPWLQALAAGRPTVIVDLEQTRDVPVLDPRSWEPPAPQVDTREPVAVAIDIVDEVHSLRLAISRLGADPGLRGRLGRAARTWWEAHHAPAHMTAGYERAIAAALARPVPAPDLPPHMRPDPTAATRALLLSVDDRLAERADLR